MRVDWAVILAVLAGLNALTYAAFAWDKRMARRGGWRVSERALLTLAVAGGWPAAKLAQRRIRHKTRKQPFARRLNRVPVAWGIVALVAGLWAMTGNSGL